MSRCPNCSYVLVFLSDRAKYKCAKCSGVFPQKEIDNKEFRNWNKRQKELDKENLKQTIKQERTINRIRVSKPKLSPEERKLREKEYNKTHYNKNKDKILSKQREKYWENHEKELGRCRIYRENNRKKKSIYNKKWIQANKEHYKQWLKSYLNNNKTENKLKKRLGHWRNKQKLLTLQFFKNEHSGVSNTKSQKVLPTFLHSELLNK